MTQQVPRSTLTVHKGPNQGTVYALHGQMLTLGRHADNQVVIDNRQVSRHHARISRRGSDWVLEDLGSANGCYVNDRRVSRPVVLNVGDVIRLGPETQLVYGDQTQMTLPTYVLPAADARPANAVAPGPVPPPPAPDAANRPSRKSRTCLVLALVGLPALLFLCLFSLLTYIGINEYMATPKQFSEILIPNVNAPEYSLSAEQQSYVDMIGYPDSFIILFYDDEDGVPTRLETWVYSNMGIQVGFANGRLESKETLSPLEAEIYPAPYRPEQFTAYANLDQVLAATELDQMLLLPLEKELLEGGESFFADQITFGMKDDRLRYVEAIGLEYQPGTPDSEPDQ